MKKQKRCIVVAQGFYEWLKKNNGKEKLPHFTKRKDGQLMCFAGLWDRVQFEGKHCRIHVLQSRLPGSRNVYHYYMPCVPAVTLTDNLAR